MVWVFGAVRAPVELVSGIRRLLKTIQSLLFRYRSAESVAIKKEATEAALLAQRKRSLPHDGKQVDERKKTKPEKKTEKVDRCYDEIL